LPQSDQPRCHNHTSQGATITPAKVPQSHQPRCHNHTSPVTATVISHGPNPQPQARRDRGGLRSLRLLSPPEAALRSLRPQSLAFLETSTSVNSVTRTTATQIGAGAMRVSAGFEARKRRRRQRRHGRRLAWRGGSESPTGTESKPVHALGEDRSRRLKFIHEVESA
jgi:hypothetical protein